MITIINLISELNLLKQYITHTVILQVTVATFQGFHVDWLIAKVVDIDLGLHNKHILLYEHNAFTSRLMLDSDEVYQMTKRRLDAAQISAAKRIHINLVLVKLLELHHLGYDLRHYHAQHHAFIKQFNLPAHFQFDVAVR